MYGSYGSYSSMAATQTGAIDIGTTRSSSSCAFPSWPQRSSLSDGFGSGASSYLSDEDLLSDSCSDYAGSSASSRSNSNASSMSPAPRNYLLQHYAPVQERTISEEELAQAQRERQAYQREVMRALAAEKERRKQSAAIARRQRRAAAAAAAAPSPRKKSVKLSAITESGEA